MEQGAGKLLVVKEVWDRGRPRQGDQMCCTLGDYVHSN